MFFIPKRVKATTGRHALVDGIPFKLPVTCVESPVLMAAFSINADKANDLLPHEVHPFRLFNSRAILVVTVINYLDTNIGKYIEYSLAIACTHGANPAPKMLPALMQKTFGTGQYVLDLPVSTEVSVKGGKGIWGMPKHIGNLNFRITEEKVTSQYDLDNQLVTYIEIDRPNKFSIPLQMGSSNYCAFRGMLMKSNIHFKGNVHFSMGKNARAKFIIGDHPRADIYRNLEVSESPLFSAFIPNAIGTLDDHFENWFLHEENKPTQQPEGLESIIDLGLKEDWPAAPSADVNEEDKSKAA